MHARHPNCLAHEAQQVLQVAQILPCGSNSQRTVKRQPALRSELYVRYHTQASQGGRQG